ncbi:hypothetical protein DSECCO2_645470 [anaerobic digester metagenome]
MRDLARTCSGIFLNPSSRSRRMLRHDGDGSCRGIYERVHKGRGMPLFPSPATPTPPAPSALLPRPLPGAGAVRGDSRRKPCFRKRAGEPPFSRHLPMQWTVGTTHLRCSCSCSKPDGFSSSGSNKPSLPSASRISPSGVGPTGSATVRRTGARPPSGGEGGSPPSPVSIAYAPLCNLSSSRAGRGSHGDI